MPIWPQSFERTSLNYGASFDIPFSSFVDVAAPMNTNGKAERRL